ncbi:uncharacterized protein LAESUDRAFT_728673 [Laetiporus sulphureus 93-53]|uniref:Uncharacterized protein n=1 Tax=Laetiporus sulphureus 93-53 TaxID=1314785 RepID=A0A165D1J0_9APHY|nr:uncharacterized protein LAESUDRAFT_728673 [Laetiporus sulphureus 93-53]KZT03961.1 hypothetical protein LAESUDRAFT_728673 [Laetiporus sulphureus 93-53]
MDTISNERSVRTPHAHAIAVGPSDGLMGNSEGGYVQYRAFMTARCQMLVGPAMEEMSSRDHRAIRTLQDLPQR